MHEGFSLNACENVFKCAYACLVNARVAYFVRLEGFAVGGLIEKMFFLCRVKQHLAFNFFQTAENSKVY